MTEDYSEEQRKPANPSSTDGGEAPFRLIMMDAPQQSQTDRESEIDKIRQSRNYSTIVASVGLSAGIGLFSLAGAHIPNQRKLQHEITLLLMIPCLVCVSLATALMIFIIFKKNTKIHELKIQSSYHSGRPVVVQDEPAWMCVEKDIHRANKALEFFVIIGLLCFIFLFGYEYRASMTKNFNNMRTY